VLIGLAAVYVSKFFATLGVSFAEKALVFVLMSTGRHIRQRPVLECSRSCPGRLRLGQPCPPDHRTTVSAAKFNQSIVAIASVTQSRMTT
jgi:hypothetical protein